MGPQVARLVARNGSGRIALPEAAADGHAAPLPLACLEPEWWPHNRALLTLGEGGAAACNLSAARERASADDVSALYRTPCMGTQCTYNVECMEARGPRGTIWRTTKRRLY